MKTLKILAFTSTGFAYALIVLGGIVRITGSGMGCGDDWPLCNGRLIPALDDPQTLIEWSHRMVALGLSVLVAATAFVAFRNRSEPGGSGPGGTLRPALAAAIILAVQVALGAITVALELPPASVVLHLIAAMVLLAALLITGLRASDELLHQPSAVKLGPLIGAAALAALVILFGGVTANMGAGLSCQGFPLCNGQVWPASGGGGLPHIHWTHRLVAYVLFLHMIGLGIGMRRKEAPDRLKEAVYLAVGLTVAQVVVAAVMVLTYLPPVWRVLHLAIGAALWLTLVHAICLASCRSERIIA
jgi:heme A synthase